MYVDDNDSPLCPPSFGKNTTVHFLKYSFTWKFILLKTNVSKHKLFQSFSILFLSEPRCRYTTSLSSLPSPASSCDFSLSFPDSSHLSSPDPVPPLTSGSSSSQSSSLHFLATQLPVQRGPIRKLNSIFKAQPFWYQITVISQHMVSFPASSCLL